MYQLYSLYVENYPKGESYILLSKYFKKHCSTFTGIANFIHHPSLTLIKPFQAQLKTNL